MNGAVNAGWLKSDIARKKCLASRIKTYFNVGHSQSEALLEWNDKVLVETSKFSVRDFFLTQNLASEGMDAVKKKDVEVGQYEDGVNDARLNLSQNNREDDYYRMNGASSSRAQPQYGQGEQYQEHGSGSYSGSSSSSGKKKKTKELKKSKFVGWENVRARNHFISKVFFIVLTLLIYNFGIMCLFIFVKPIKNFARKYWWVYIISFICFAVFALVLGCCPSVSRKSPINYIMLFFASTFLGLALGWISASYDIFEVLLAVGVTIAIVFFLALIAIFSPCDFTILIGVVAVIGLCLCAFGIMMIFFYNKWLYIVYCSIGILVASLSIVIDIQMICGGKNRRFQYSEKDYAVAALILYIDIAFLLMMVLGLTGAANG